MQPAICHNRFANIILQEIPFIYHNLRDHHCHFTQILLSIEKSRLETHKEVDLTKAKNIADSNHVNYVKSQQRNTQRKFGLNF